MVEQLGVGVEAQAEAVDDVVARGLQLFRARSFGEEGGERGAHHGERLLGLSAARLQADLERPGHLLRRQEAVHAVRETALLAHLLGQPRHEAAPAEHVVADQQREVIRVLARHAQLADEDMGLRRRVRNVDDLRRGRGRCSRGHGRFGGGQGFGEADGDAFGGGAVEVADDGHRGEVGAVVASVEVHQIIAADGGERFGRAVVAVGVAGVQRGVELARGQGRGLGQRLA